ncbi:hypothetical protein [Mesorhizobium sp. A556]
MKLTGQEAYQVSFPSLHRFDLCAKQEAPAATIADMTVEQRR